MAAAQISVDIGLSYTQISWIVTAYSITFASFLLFFGRWADLYSPIHLFSGGVAGLGVISLIISFIDNKVCTRQRLPRFHVNDAYA